MAANAKEESRKKEGSGPAPWLDLYDYIVKTLFLKSWLLCVEYETAHMSKPAVHFLSKPENNLLYILQVKGHPVSKVMRTLHSRANEI